MTVMVALLRGANWRTVTRLVEMADVTADGAPGR